MVLVESAYLVRDEQLRVIQRAILAISERGDLVNTVLYIALDGTMTFELPPPS